MLHNIKAKFNLGDKVTLKKMQAGNSGTITVIVHPNIFWTLIMPRELDSNQIEANINSLFNNWASSCNTTVEKILKTPVYGITFERVKAMLPGGKPTGNAWAPECNVEHTEEYWKNVTSNITSD